MNKLASKAMGGSDIVTMDLRIHLEIE